jgi:hypothetical protein
MPKFTLLPTKSGRVTTNANGTAHITFITPFVANDYTVALSVLLQNFGNKVGAIAYASNLTVDGFDITTLDVKQGNAYGGVTVSWLATINANL